MDINRDNYESFLLSYLDGELTPNDKESAEKFLAENTDLQKEFSALKSLRLIPDEIYFEEKHLLLRREEKRRVLPLYWLRMTAVIMVGIAGTWLLSKNEKIEKNEKMGKIEKLKIEKNEKMGKIEKNEKNEKIGKIEKLKIEGKEKNEKIGKIEKLKIEKNEKMGKIEKLKNEKEKIEVVEPTEEIADIQKSRINVKPETTAINPLMDTRQIPAPEMKMNSLLAAAPTVPLNHNSNTISSVSEPTDQSEDVSISVLSLSAKNKPATGFFKKLLKNTGSEKNGRTVNVSVLQISY